MARRDCKACGHSSKRHVTENDVPTGEYDLTWAAKLLGIYRECGGSGTGGTPCDCQEYE